MSRQVDLRSQQAQLNATQAPQAELPATTPGKPQVSKGRRHPSDDLLEQGQLPTDDSAVVVAAASQPEAQPKDTQQEAAGAAAPGADAPPVDPNAIVEAAPTSIGPVAAAGGLFSGVSTTTAVAAGTAGVAAVGVAASGGKGGGKDSATPADTQAPSAVSLSLQADTGTSSTDKITNNGSLAVSGTEAGAHLEYSTDGGKTWSANYAAHQGVNEVMARQIDAAGNVSANSSLLTFTLVTSVDTPVVATALAGNVQSGSGSGGNPTQVYVTDISKLSFAPEAKGTTRSYLVDNQAPSGTYTPPKAGQDQYIIKVTDTDVAGNELTQTFNVHIDTTAPAAPIIVGLKTDTGTSATDKLTNDSTLTLSGKEDDAKVEYSLDGGKTWSSTPAPKEGTNSVIAHQTDLAGNTSAASSTFTFTFDSTSPTAPTASLTSDTFGAGTTGTATDKLTQNADLTFSAPGADVVSRSFAVDGGTPGSSYVKPSADGSHTVRVTDTDAAGNSVSTDFTFTLDTKAPTAPAIKLTADTGSSGTDGITQKAAVQATSSEAGGKIEYSADNGTTWVSSITAKEGTQTVLARVTDPAGNVSTSTSLTFTNDNTAPTAPTLKLTADSGSLGSDGITQKASVLATSGEAGGKIEYSADNGATWVSSITAKEGTQTVLARVTDVAGNVSPSASLTFTNDNTAPTAPSLKLTADSGSSATDGITQNASVLATSGEAGGKIEYSADNGTTWVNSITAKEGAQTVLARVTDAAGNVSPSASLTFTNDNTAPTAPTLKLTADTGSSPSDGITQKAAVLATSTEPGGKIEYSADNGATWVSSITAKEGTQTVLARVTDAAGNVSTSSPLTFTNDNTAPAAPTLQLTADTGSSAVDNITQKAAVVASSAEPGGKIEYSADNGTTWVSSITAKEGAQTVLARVTDVAGNVSTTATLTFTNDNTAPTAPTLKLVSDTGASATDLITQKASVLATSTEINGKIEYSADNGATWASSITAKEGQQTVLARVTDVAGNVSPSASLTFTNDNTAPASVAVTVDGDNLVNHVEQAKLGYTVSGLEAGATATVTFTDGLKSVTSTTSTGTGTADLSSLADGTIKVSVSTTDVAGNQGTGTGQTLTLDGIATPTATLSNDTSATGMAGGSSDLITKDATITFSATPADLLKRTFTVDGGTPSGTYVAPTTDGKHTVTVTDEDQSHNIATSAPLTFTLDSKAPGQPTVSLTSDTFGADTTGTAADKLTQNADLTISAPGVDVVTRSFVVDGGTPGSSYAKPTADGLHTVVVTDADAAGNSVSTSFSFTLDKAAPAAPALKLTGDTGISTTDGITQKAAVLATSGEAGGKIEYSADNGTTWVSSITPKEGQQTVLARVTDPAGNVSTSASLTFTNDNTAPTVPTLKLTADSGSLGSDGITQKASVLATSGEAGGKIEYSADNGATWVSSITAKEGTQTVLARVTDVAGNVSPGATLTFTNDNTAPTAPVLKLTADTGSSPSDGITQKATVVATSTEVGGKIEYSADNGANWVSSITAKEGTQTVLARVTDVAGNVSPSAMLTFTNDNTAPTAPTLRLTADSGSLATDGITQNASLLATSAEADGKIEYSTDNGTTWVSSITAKEGAQTVLARVTDVAGNVSPSATLTFTNDNTAPTAPTLKLVSDTGASATDLITQKASVLATSSEAGGKIEYSTDNGTTWVNSITAKEGTQTVLARVTDVAGNVSPSASLTFTNDNTAPAAPTLKLTTDTGNSPSDGVSQVGTINATGTEAGAKVEYSVDGGKNWSTSFTAVEGTNNVIARQTDVAGNVSVNSGTLSFNLDTAAPIAPTLKLIADTGSSTTDSITQSANVLATSGEAGGKIEYSADNGATWVSSITAKEGTQTVLARVTDVAGNVSPGATLTFTNDNTAPTAPVLKLTADTGSSPSDGITQKATVVATSTEVGGKIEYSADNGANWVSSITVKEGTQTVLARVTDVAGNVSPSASLTFTNDNTAPPSLGVSVAGDTYINAAEQNTVAYTVTGLGAEPASTRVDVTFTDSTGKSVTQTAAAGKGSVDLSGLKDGPISVGYTATDVAGNTSSNTASAALTLDRLIATPTVALTRDTGIAGDGITSDPNLTFSVAEVGAKRTFTVDGGAPTTGYTPPSNAGVHTVVVTDTDLAGNTASSATFKFTLDTSLTPTPVLALKNDTGTSTTDAITNDPTVAASNPLAGASIEYSLDNGTTWSASIAPKEGQVSVIARQISSTGIASANSAALVFTYDKTAPVALVASLSTDSGASATDGITNTVLLGYQNREANTTLEYSVDGASWSKSFAPADGAHSVQTRQIDLAGNTSAASNTINFTLDTKAPTGFAVTINSPDTLVNRFEQGALGYTVNGLEVGAKATVTFTDSKGLSVISTSGKADLSSLSDGVVNVSVTAVDAAGNWGTGTGQIVTLDGLTTPTVTLKTDSGFSNSDGYTNSGALIFSAVPADIQTREYTVNDITSTTLPSILLDGTYVVSVTDTDKAGNVATSAELTFTLDTKVATPIVALDIDSGPPGDLYTNTGYVHATNAETGTPAGFYAQSEYSTDGGTTWSNTFTAQEGSNTVRMRQTDAAGNVSAASTPLTFTLDTHISTPTISFPVTLVTDANKTNVAYTAGGLDGDILNTTVVFTDTKGHTAYATGGHANLSSLSDGPVTATLYAQDKANNKAASNTVSLQLSVFDYKGMSASGNQVVLQFNKALDASHLPTVDDFRLVMTDTVYDPILSNTHTLSVTNVAVSSTDPGKLVLTLAKPLSTSGTLQVAYNDVTQSGLNQHHIASTEGRQLGWISDSKAISLTPTITSIQSTDEPMWDAYSGKPGETLDLQVYFSEPVMFNQGAGNSTPTLTVTVLSADGSTHDLTAVFSPWDGFDYSFSVSSAQFKVPLDQYSGITGSWKVKSFNLNGATVTAGLPDGTTGLALDPTLTDKAADFAANARLFGLHIVDPGAGTVDHSSSTVSELFNWNDPTQAPASMVTSTNPSFASVKAGSGARDGMVVPIILSDTLTAEQASLYHLFYDDASKSVQIYQEGSATPIRTVAVPQGAAWPTGMEILYYNLMYTDATTNEVTEVNQGDEGILLAKSILAYQDPQRGGDVFIQGTGTGDTINLSNGSITLVSGGTHTVNAATDRIVIQAGPGNDTITGSAAADTIVGDQGNNVINAGAGNDTIFVHRWERGNSTIDGGDGIDTLRLSLKDNHISVAVDDQGQIALSSFNYDYSTNTSGAVEPTQYTLKLDEATNKLVLLDQDTPVQGSNTLTGVEAVTIALENNDTVTTATLKTGTSGTDLLTSDGTGSVVFGGAGDDVLKAIGNADILVGGSGNDTLVFDVSKSTNISGGAGTDTAVAIASVYGPLVAKVNPSDASSWLIANVGDTALTSPLFKLSKDASGVYTLYTLAAADLGISPGVNNNGKTVYPSTTLAGIETLKIVAPDGGTLGSFDLSNPTAAVNVTLADTSIDGKSVVLTFSSNLDAAKLPDVTAFSVTTSKGATAVTSMSVSGNKLTLNLADHIDGRHVYVNYADPSKAADTKALHFSTGADVATFTADTYVAGPVAKITSITTEDGYNLAANAGSDDSIPLYVHFNSRVSVTAAADGSVPTLTLKITAPDGSSTHTVDAVLQRGNDSPSTNTDVLRFEAPLGNADIGTVTIDPQSVNLHGATIKTLISNATADVTVTSAMVPLLSNTYFYGGNLSEGATSYTGTAGNDVAIVASDKVAGAVTGDFSGITGGAGGNRDMLAVFAVLPSYVTDGSTASQYELRYNGSGSTKYVEVWKFDGASAVQQLALPDAAHWPSGVEILDYELVFRDAQTGEFHWTDVRPLTFSQSSVAYGSGNDFTVNGSLNGDAIDARNGASLTLPNMAGGSASHTVVAADQLLLMGNTGNDTITGHDAAGGVGGIDVVSGGQGANVINTGSGNDRIVINQGGSNTIDGGVDQDTVQITLVGQNGDAYADTNGVLHIMGQYYDAATGKDIATVEQYSLSFDETSANTIKLVDALHGNALSTVSNVENIDINVSDNITHLNSHTLTFGTSGADNLTATGADAVVFGGAGNDTLTARGDSVTLMGGSGNDTLSFSFDSSAILSGGTGTDKAVLTIGSVLPPLTLAHDSGSLVWSLQDMPGHSVIQLTLDEDTHVFQLDTAGGADLGYGKANLFTGHSDLSSIETLVIQTSAGTPVTTLQLDGFNKPNAVIPV